MKKAILTMMVSVILLTPICPVDAKKLSQETLNRSFGRYLVTETYTKSCDRKDEPHQCTEFIVPQVYISSSDNYVKINEVIHSFCPASLIDLDAGEGRYDEYKCEVNFVNDGVISITSEVFALPGNNGNGSYGRSHHLVTWKELSPAQMSDFFKNNDDLESLIKKKFTSEKGCDEDWPVPPLDEWVVNKKGVSIECNQGYSKLFAPMIDIKWDELKDFLRSTDEFTVHSR